MKNITIVQYSHVGCLMFLLQYFLLVCCLLQFSVTPLSAQQSDNDTTGQTTAAQNDLLSYYSQYWGIGGQELRNRIVVALTWRASSDQVGHLSDLLITVIKNEELISDTEKLSILLAVLEQVAAQVGEDAEIFEILNYGRNVNQTDVSYEIITNPAYGWGDPVPDDEKAFHVIGILDPDDVEKYSHPDGREAVFIRNSVGDMVHLKDGTNDATYNYVPNYGLGDTIRSSDVSKFVNDNYLHMVLDVVPWLVYGVSPEDKTTISQRIAAFEESDSIRTLQTLYVVARAANDSTLRVEVALEQLGVTLEQLADPLNAADAAGAFPEGFDITTVAPDGFFEPPLNETTNSIDQATTVSEDAEVPLACNDPGATLTREEAIAALSDNEFDTRPGGNLYAFQSFGPYDTARNRGMLTVAAESRGEIDSYEVLYAVNDAGRVCFTNTINGSVRCEIAKRCSFEGTDDQLVLFDQDGRFGTALVPVGPEELYGCTPSGLPYFPQAMFPEEDGSTLLGRTKSGNDWTLNLGLSGGDLGIADFTNSAGTIVEGAWRATATGICQSYNGEESWSCHDVLACEGETNRFVMRNSDGELSSVVEVSTTTGFELPSDKEEIFAFGIYATEQRYCEIDSTEAVELGDAIGTVTRLINESGWHYYESVCQPQDYTVSGETVTMNTICEGEGTQWFSSKEVQRLNSIAFREGDSTFQLCPSSQDQNITPDTASINNEPNTIANYEAPLGSQWVQVASRQNVTEAREVASGLGESARIFRTENGWYAITATVLQEPEWISLDSIIRGQGWPTDSLLTRGSGFVEAIAVDPSVGVLAPFFTYTTTTRRTQLFARSFRDEVPDYTPVQTLEAGQDVVVWGQPDLHGDCLVSGNEGVIVKCADLVAFDQLSDEVNEVVAESEPTEAQTSSEEANALFVEAVVAFRQVENQTGSERASSLLRVRSLFDQILSDYPDSRPAQAVLEGGSPGGVVIAELPQSGVTDERTSNIVETSENESVSGDWESEQDIRYVLNFMEENWEPFQWDTCQESYGPINSEVRRRLFEGTTLTVRSRREVREQVVTDRLLDGDRFCIGSNSECAVSDMRLFYCASGESLFWTGGTLMVGLYEITDIRRDTAEVAQTISVPLRGVSGRSMPIEGTSCRIPKLFTATTATWTGQCNSGIMEGSGTITWMSGSGIVWRTPVGPEWGVVFANGELMASLDLSPFDISLARCESVNRGLSRTVSISAPSSLPADFFANSFVVDEIMKVAIEFAGQACPASEASLQAIVVEIRQEGSTNRRVLASAQNEASNFVSLTNRRNEVVARLERQLRQENSDRIASERAQEARLQAQIRGQEIEALRARITQQWSARMNAHLAGGTVIDNIGDLLIFNRPRAIALLSSGATIRLRTDNVSFRDGIVVVSDEHDPTDVYRQVREAELAGLRAMDRYFVQTQNVGVDFSGPSVRAVCRLDTSVLEALDGLQTAVFDVELQSLDERSAVFDCELRR